MSKYIIFDTETTGIEEEDRILQIAGLIIDSKGEAELYDEIINPQHPISFESMSVHNITPELVEGKPLFAESSFYKRLNELNNPENYLIAHNLPFDLTMIKKEGFKENLKLIDTLRVAKHILPDEKRKSLQYLRFSRGLYHKEEALMKEYNIVLKAHDAMGDVAFLKLLVSDLVSVITSLYPDKNPMEIMVDLTKQPVLLKTLPFGKYKDMSFEELSRKDRGYMNWMKNNMADLDEDMLFTLNKWL